MVKGISGFTLIEILVVLVITSLTTTLITMGLNTTWNNFAKLDSRQLTLNVAQLPKTWFRNSIEGALMFHPDTPTFFGTTTQMKLISFATPSSQNRSPTPLMWQLLHDAGITHLGFTYGETSEEIITIAQIIGNAHFEYQTESGWQRNFSSSKALLPRAVRVQTDSGTWTFAAAGRPANPDIPAEIPAYGRYEF